MSFTFHNYKKKLKQIIEKDYICVSYFSNISEKKNILLRHDIDIDIYNCKRIAKVENDLGLFSTFFVQPNNDYYNPMSAECLRILSELSEKNDIGLHIDPQLFSNINELSDHLNSLYIFYSNYMNLKKVFSFHRPAKFLLSSEIKINGFVNAYEEKFIKKMCYVSDSNRRDFLDEDGIWNALKHSDSITILTHPIWWSYKNRLPVQIVNHIHKQSKKNADSALSRNITLFAEHFLQNNAWFSAGNTNNININ